MNLFKHSVRSKLIALLLLATILPLLTSILITYFQTKNSLRERAIAENIQLISEGRSNIRNFLDSFSENSLTLYSNMTVDSIIVQGLQDYASETRLFTVMQIIANSSPDIEQVFLSVEPNRKSYLLDRNFFHRGTDAYRPALPVDLKPYSVYIEPTHDSHNYGISQVTVPAGQKVFTFHRPIYRVPTEEQIALLSIDIRLEALSKLTTRLYDPANEELYIVDENDSVIFASAGSVDSGSHPAWSKELFARKGDSGYLDWNEKDFSGILIFTKIANADMNWMMVKRIAYHDLYAYARHLTYINSIVLGLFVSVALVAVLAISIWLTKPLKQFIAHINKIQAGQLEAPIPIEREDEFGILARRFQTMMTTINDSINQEYKLKLANRMFQLKMLQAQINPHFMNNVLQSIGKLALDNREHKIYSLISALGQMNYYSMNLKETVVHLFKEMEYVSFYCELQQHRFGDTLQIRVDIAQETNLIRIPKMVVQPIVENYFAHGYITTAKNTGVLRIRTWMEGERLAIEVEDNGVGVPPDRMEFLKAKLESGDGGSEFGEGIGLTNVMTRLQLFYNGQASMQLQACSPSGLRVTLRLPVQPLHEEEAG